MGWLLNQTTFIMYQEKRKELKGFGVLFWSFLQWYGNITGKLRNNILE